MDIKYLNGYNKLIKVFFYLYNYIIILNGLK